MLTYGLNLVVGFGGLLSLSHAVFYGMGAYATALLTIKAGFSFIPALVLSAFFTGICSLLLGFPALRFRGDSFVLVTLGFQIIFFTILYNWTKFTGGPFGISGIPKPILAGVPISSPLEYLVITLIIFAIVLSILFVIYRSPFGLALKALRDDEMAAECFGKSPRHLFTYAFVLSGVVASIAGSLYAVYVTFIDPTSFSLDESIFVLSVLLVGGTGNKKGPFIGTLFMLILPEILRLVGLPDTVAANVRQAMYGLILIVLMFVRPQGIGGDYTVR